MRFRDPIGSKNNTFVTIILILILLRLLIYVLIALLLYLQMFSYL